jgi:UDP-2,3-diacylglucosamine pyrophosphatase LpxH
MLDEYFLWKEVFNSFEEEKIEKFINLLIQDKDARKFVTEKIIELKKNQKDVYKLSINIDESMTNYPVGELAKEIVNEIISKENE